MEIIVKNLSLAYNVKNLDSSFLRKSLIKKFFSKSNKKIDQIWALNNLNFELSKGDRLGVIGPNGSGKSTLIKCLSNIYKPAEGSEVIVSGKFLPIIEPWALSEPVDSVVNNIILIGLILGFDKKYIVNNIDNILKFSELENKKDYQFSSLSTGMKLRLIFAIVFLLETEIFLIDEFLTTGDEKFRKKCFTHLIEKTQNSITVICSHERNTIKEFCNKVLVLEKGKQAYFGDIDEGFRKYDEIIMKKVDS